MTSCDARAVAVIGKTGSGKSTLCNAITQSKDFPEGKGGMSKTVDCKDKTVTAGNRKLTVVDTPGTRDVKDKEKALSKMDSALQSCPDGVDAFLVAMRCDVRTTDEECQAIEDAVDTFGPESHERAIVIFTRGGEYKNNETKFLAQLVEIRKAVPRLDALLNKFGNRWLLMDNGKKCDPQVRERQMSNLLTLVDKVAQQNSRRYKKEDLELQKKKKNEEKEEERKKESAERERRNEEERMRRLELEQVKLHHKLEMASLESRILQATYRGPTQQSVGITDVLASVGQGAGKVLVSPFAGAAALLGSALNR